MAGRLSNMASGVMSQIQVRQLFYFYFLLDTITVAEILSKMASVNAGQFSNTRGQSRSFQLVIINFSLDSSTNGSFSLRYGSIPAVFLYCSSSMTTSQICSTPLLKLEIFLLFFKRFLPTTKSFVFLLFFFQFYILFVLVASNN